MIKIVHKSKCTGCTACAQICPISCITMKRDEEGFLYPVADESRCIACGSCDKVCPVSNTSFLPKAGYPEAALIYDKELEWRKRSAAGGGFAVLARYFLEYYKGIVFGAAYDENYYVCHMEVETLEALPQLQKSKYVQSDLKDCFKCVKQHLEHDRYVLFSGTPCQIYGLKSYLGKQAESDRLYSIDLSCHGVPSPKVFEKYKLALEEQEKSQIICFTMRDKKFKKDAYDQGFGITFANNKKKFLSHSQDMFGRCFWGELISRPSCYCCHFKTVWRSADITLGDCWFLNCFVPEEKDDFGVTLALMHSEKGKKLLNENLYSAVYPVPSELLIKANGGMICHSAKANEKRTVFFEQLDQRPFSALVDELLPVQPLSSRQKILKVMDRLGIRFNLLRKKSRQKKLAARLKMVIPDSAKGELQ